MPTAIVTKRNVSRGRKAPQNSRSSKDPVGQYASDAWSLAKRTAVGLNEIRKFINIETKNIDQTGTSTAITQTGFVASLTQMAQGTNYTGRIGDSIRIQRIIVRARVLVSSAATASTVRMLIFRDLDGYGTAAATSEVLHVVGSARAPLSQYNALNMERFSILYDELLTVSPAANPMEVCAFDSTHQGHVRYLGTAANAASDGKGTVYIAFVSDEPTNTPTASYESRVFFTDD